MCGLKIFLAFAVLAFCATAALAVQESKGVIAGRVVNDRGKGIAGAKVMAEGDADSVSEATTNEKGEFRLELATGEYRLSFEAEGYANTSLRDRVTVEPNKQTKLKEKIQMPAARQGSVIRGSVFAGDGRSIAGVRVFLERVAGEDGKPVPSFKMDGRSDTTGLFAFRVPKGEARYRLTAVLDGYEPASVTVDVFGGEILNAPPLKMLRKGTGT